MLIVLDHEPKLLFRLAKHSSQVDLITMVEPVAIRLADYLRQRSLVRLLRWLLLERLMQGFNRDLGPAFIIIDKFLFTDDTTRAKVPNRLLLQLFALEVEQAERIFLPRLRLNHQSVQKYQ